MLTGQDVTGIRIGRQIYDMPLLADGVVRFTGEKVAAVAADTEEAAEQALDQIRVEYEELQPLLSPADALAPSAPLLHPEVLHYKGLPGKLAAPSNAFVRLSWKKGDIEEGLRRSSLVLENVFETQVAHQAYIEPHSCVVKANDSAGGEIWACSKVPFALRQQMAAAFGLEPEKFLVHPSISEGISAAKGISWMCLWPTCYLGRVVAP